MLSVSNILCGHSAGNEQLRYSHRAAPAPGSVVGERKGVVRLVETPRPVVVWALTRACNQKCVHCYASATAEAGPDELSTRQGMELLDDLAAFRVPAVLFSGGEPLRHPDAMTLLEHAVGLGLRVSLSTNGTLITRSVAERLARVGVQYVGVSLDGRPGRHDKLRGMVGAAEASFAGIRRCQDAGVRVGLRFTVHALNAEDLGFIFDTAVAKKIDRLCIYHLAYAGRGTGMQRVDLTPGQTRAVVADIFRRTRELHDRGIPLEVLTVGNHADAAYAVLSLRGDQPDRAEATRARLARTGGNQSGNFIASIDPRGGVHYDQFSWHHTLGSIRDRPFSALWTDAADPRLAILRDRQAHLPARCRGCGFLDLCNGNLRTRAEAATGDWLGDDPACYLTEEEIAAG